MADHKHEGQNHEGHDHDHDHDHDHKEEEMPQLENQGDTKAAQNRGEKKCRKALIKLGMKQVTGITRVAVRRRDGSIFVVNEPDVLQSAESAGAFAIFGELRFEDPNARFSQSEAKKFMDKPAADAQPAAKDEAKVEEDSNAPLSEEGLTAEHITMVMDHAKCPRNAAIKALRESNDDMIAAVMKLTN